VAAIVVCTGDAIGDGEAVVEGCAEGVAVEVCAGVDVSAGAE
jgi:hypothetical protein